ncbi:MAG: hypothetical protein JWN62_2860 [Acidimicrobiales bacterium]|nr:hypothetical protein [Acidimicrobiales bacterium]
MLFREALSRAPKSPRRLATVWAGALVASAAAVTSVVDVATPVHAVTPLEVSAWAPYYSSAAGTSLGAHSSTMSESTLFFYSATSATTIATTTGNGNASILSAARAAQTAGKPIIATITDGLPARAMATVLADPAQRAAHEQALLDFLNANNFEGVDLDYEKFAFSDGRSTWLPASQGGLDTYANWGAFVTELGTLLHGAGKRLEVSVPPIYDGGKSTSSGYWVYNYPAMNSAVDRIKVMMYAYSVGSPGPIAPYNWVSTTMDYLKSAVAPAKLVLGIPAYGTDWVTKVDGSCPTSALASNATLKRNPTTVAAFQNASKAGQTPTWNATYHEYTYNYIESYSGGDANNITVRCNIYRTVWFVDAQGIADRAKMASDKALAGIAIWALGYEDSPTWDGIAAASAGQAFAAPKPPAPSNPPVAPAVLVAPAAIDSSGPLPARYLDTRPGFKTLDGVDAGIKQVGAGSTTEIAIAGRGPVPGDAKAVTLNVTVLGTAADGFVTVYPCGTQPTTSNLNVRAGQIISNAVITKLSAAGTVCIYSQRAADLVVDVFNVLPDSSVKALANPARLLDTRANSPTIDSVGAGAGPLGVGDVVVVPVAGRGGISATAKSAVLNVTAVGASAGGFLTVWPCDGTRPATSNVNFPKSSPVPNAVVTALSATGTVCIYASNPTDVIVDVFGELDPSTFSPMAQPARLMETRDGYGTIDGSANAMGKRGLSQDTTLMIAGRGGLPNTVGAVVLNVTVDAPELSGYVTVYPCGTARPPVSNVNFAPNQTLPNLVVTKLSSAGTICIFTSSPTHVIVDVFGSLAL